MLLPVRGSQWENLLESHQGDRLLRDNQPMFVLVREFHRKLVYQKGCRENSVLVEVPYRIWQRDIEGLYKLVTLSPINLRVMRSSHFPLSLHLKLTTVKQPPIADYLL